MDLLNHDAKGTYIENYLKDRKCCEGILVTLDWKEKRSAFIRLKERKTRWPVERLYSGVSGG